jgi:glycosyltransferase involved in cell wall biosynthesis
MKAIMVDSLVGNDYSTCLCSALAEAGVDITLIVPENRIIGGTVNFPVKYWAPTKETGYSRYKKTTRYFNFLLKLLLHIKGSKVDIVHFQFFRRERIESFYFCLLRLLAVNLVITAHNVLPHEKGKIDLLLKYIVYRSAKSIVTHSNFVKQKLSEMFRISEKKIKVIPHGDFDIYLSENSLSKHDARVNLDLSDKDHVLLFFGLIRDYKGLPFLLDAFEIAAGSDRQLKLIIAGQPPTAESEQGYRQRIAQIESKDRIIFHSKFIPNEQVADYFIATDIVALPYKNIYHSGIVHLAFSFGRPIVATRVGDFIETIENGKNGFVLDENTTENMAKMIAAGFSDEQRLMRMGKFARYTSETKYSWDRIARLTRKLYEQTAHISC